MHGTQLQHHQLASKAARQTVDYLTLVPDCLNAGKGFPAILHLHGALSSSESLVRMRGLYESAWKSGVLPPAVVACASTPTLGGFYIDYPDGPGWETVIGHELLKQVEETFGCGGRRALVGSSMGGYGALKIALRKPGEFTAVAALCPVVLPGETPEDVPQRNIQSVLAELLRSMGEDAPAYQKNCVMSIARQNALRLREGATQIFVDCGEHDEYMLYDGAQYLHQVLQDLNIPHSFRIAAGAKHVCERFAGRMTEALEFVGRALSS